MDFNTVFVSVLLVYLSCRQCVGAAVFLCVLIVKSSREGADDLESGTGLAGCVGGPVEGPAGFLFTASSQHSHDIAGILVGYSHGNIGLGSKLIVFLIGILRTHDRFAECFDILFGAGLGCVHDAVVFILPQEIGLHAVAVIVGLGAVRSGDSQSVIEIVFGSFGEVAGIFAALFVHNGLNIGILCGIDPETSAVEEGSGLFRGERISLVQSAVLHQVRILEVAQDLSDQRVDKIGIGLVVDLFLLTVDLGDFFVDILLKGAFVFFLGDVTLRKHMFQDDFLALPVVFRIDDRVVSTGILCDSRQHSALRQ